MVECGELDCRRGELPGLNRPPLVDTPAPALNQAFAWAVRLTPAAVRAEPGRTQRWDDDEFEDLLEASESFRRVGPATGLDPYQFIHRVVEGLFGVQADGAGGRFETRPWVPASWRSMALRRLRCHRTILDLEVRSRAEWVTVRFDVSFGPPVPFSVRIRNRGPVAQVTIDETPVDSDLAIFTVGAQHEVTFFLGRTSGTEIDPGSN